MKNFVVDTNVLIDDPNAINKFEDNIVCIPIGVIQELDSFKKETDVRGRNARQASRNIENELKNSNCKLKILIDKQTQLHVDNVDSHILQIVQNLIHDNKEILSILVTNDVNLRLRARALGITSEEYQNNRIELDQLDRGYQIIDCDIDYLEDVLKNGADVEDRDEFVTSGPNHYFHLRNQEFKRSVLLKMNSKGTQIVRVEPKNKKSRLSSRNHEQTCVMDALYDPEIRLVAISGKAGCGKTLLAVDAGYTQAVMSDDYSRLLISRPVFPMGRDLGYLPGSVDEKLDPWMQPIYDALDVIGSSGKKNSQKTNAKKIIETKKDRIRIEPLTYIRGRSIHQQFMIVDEVQNMNHLETKTVLTRAGENTKIILTGDIEQIDNPYIDQNNNGLSAVIRAFSDSGLAAHIIMSNGIRSPLATEASERM